MADYNEIREALKFIRPESLGYQEWVNVGFALYSAGMSCSMWDSWSNNGIDDRYKPGVCEKKWKTFSNKVNGITEATLFGMATDNGYRKTNDIAMNFDDVIETDAPSFIVEKPFDPVDEFKTYLQTLFAPEDNVSFVVRSFQDDGKYKPADKGDCKKCKLLLNECERYKDLSYVIGDWNLEAGAWIRFNPTDGQGVGDKNITAFRYVLVECDEIPLEQQNALYRKLNLPIAVLVSSGGRSLHAIVKINAATKEEYRQRVEMLYAYLEKNGVEIDSANKNASRLSRLPGVTRGGVSQRIEGTNIGAENWDAWQAWIAEREDNLPQFISFRTIAKNMPPKKEELIEGVLRRGQKMLLSASSKAGKTWLLQQLAIAFACGGTWLDDRCRKSKVLYLDTEMEMSESSNRIAAICRALAIDATADFMDNFSICFLKGKCRKLSDMLPSILRRMEKQNFDVIMIDPIYKLGIGDENSAEDIGEFCNQLDKISFEANASPIYSHHHSKGYQLGKKAQDRASGSGVFARDADAIIDLTEIDLSNNTDILESTSDRAFQVEYILRAFDRKAPKRVWFRYPIHVIDDAGILNNMPLEGEMLSGTPGRPKKLTDIDIATACSALSADSDSDGYLSMHDLISYFDGMGISERTIYNVIKYSTRFDKKKGYIKVK